MDTFIPKLPLTPVATVFAMLPPTGPSISDAPAVNAVETIPPTPMLPPRERPLVSLVLSEVPSESDFDLLLP